MNKTIVVLGATGKVGGKISDILLQEGHKVKVIARGTGLADRFKHSNAEIIQANMTDAEALGNAFKNADSAFIMIPPHFTTDNYREFQRTVGDATIEAIKKSGIKFIVNLSSAGAHMHEGNGIIAGLAEQEVKLNQLTGVNVLHLRPAYFMDNSLLNINLVKTAGMNGSTADAHHKIPMVATKDIATIAANHLSQQDFRDKSVQAILGDRDYSFTDVTHIIGASIGMPDLQFVQFPVEQAKQAMTGFGISENVVNDIINMEVSLKDGIMNYHMRTSANSAPTSFEIFAKDVFAPAYNS